MATAIAMPSSQPGVTSSTMPSSDGVGDLTGLGWLSNVTLSLAALEVDGEKLPGNIPHLSNMSSNTKSASHFSMAHGSSSISNRKGSNKRSSKQKVNNTTSQVPRLNRCRSYSTSAVPNIQKIIGSESTTIDDISNFLGSVTGSGVQIWNEAKKSLTRPPYSLDCYIALAIRTLKKSSTPSKITDCLRSRIPFYAKQNHDSLLLSVNRSLKRNSFFAETTSGVWSCTVSSHKRASSPSSKSPHQRKRANSLKKESAEPARKRKAPKPRSKSLSALSIPSGVLLHLQSQAHAAAAQTPNLSSSNNVVQNSTSACHTNMVETQHHQNALNLLDLSDAGIFLDDDMFLNLKDSVLSPKDASMSMDTTSVSSDSAFASDTEPTLDICDVSMKPLVPQFDILDNNQENCNSLLFSPFDDDQSRVGWMPTTYIPGLLTDNLFDGSVDVSPASLSTIC